MVLCRGGHGWPGAALTNDGRTAQTLFILSFFPRIYVTQITDFAFVISIIITVRTAAFLPPMHCRRLLLRSGCTPLCAAFFLAMDLYMDVLMSREHMDVRSDCPSPAPFHTGLGILPIPGGNALEHCDRHEWREVEQRRSSCRDVRKRLTQD